VPGDVRSSEDVPCINKAIRAASQRREGNYGRRVCAGARLESAPRARNLTYLVAAVFFAVRTLLFAYSDFFFMPSDWYSFESLPYCAAT
jgi:hypothetical protein